MKYILITGGLGYIGSHLTVHLLNKKMNVIIVDNLSNSIITQRENILKTTTNPNPNLMVRIFDIRDRHKLINELSPYQISCIFHLASYKSVPESIQEPYIYYQSSLEGVLSLLFFIDHLEYENTPRIIFSSTAAVYEGHEPPFREEMNPTLNITNSYGQSKAMIEKILKDVCETENINCTILRYFNPYEVEGDLIDYTGTNVYEIIRTCQKKDTTFQIFGENLPTRDGTCIRDFIHISELIKQHIQVLEYTQKEVYEVFNLGTGNGKTVLELVREAEERYNKKIKIEYTNPRKGDIVQCYANTDKFKNEIINKV